MAHRPIPQPLYDVLRNVLHANLFSTWRSDLLRWELAHPEAAAPLRAQIAASALTDAVDPDLFQRLTGHWAQNSEVAKAWFAKLYTDHYGPPPELSDFAEP
jgi:hypothetical protein